MANYRLTVIHSGGKLSGMNEDRIRRYTWKLYPNATQSAELDRMRMMHCRLYNAGLEERIAAHRSSRVIVPKGTSTDGFLIRWAGATSVAVAVPDGENQRQFGYFLYGRDGKTLTFFDQQKHIKTIRADDPDYAAMSSASLALTLKRLDLAFQAFYRRAKGGAGASSGFPKFRPASDFPGFGFRESGNGWKFIPRSGNSALVYIKGISGDIEVRGKFPGAPQKILSADAMWRENKWWLSVVAELPRSKEAAGKEQGEVSFGLIDDFARVRRVNGGYTAGPEETVYAAANGRIIPLNSVGYKEAPAVPPEMGANCRKDRVAPLPRIPAVPPEMGANCRRMSMHSRSASPAVTPGTEVNCRQSLHVQVQGDPAVTPGTEVNCRPAADGVRPFVPAVPPETGANYRKKLTPGSIKDRRLREKMARLSAKEARRRQYALHGWTSELAKEFGSVRIEKPPMREIVKSGRGTHRDPGAMVQWKADINKRFLAQAPAMAAQMLAYKIEERGGFVETVTVKDHEAEVATTIAKAAKANRKAKRTIKNAR